MSRVIPHTYAQTSACACILPSLFACAVNVPSTISHPLQVAELQAAAQGVPTWQQQLAREPSGHALLATIDDLHAARHRLTWLQQEGLAHKHRLAVSVLRLKEARFKQQYPDYPGDTAAAE